MRKLIAIALLSCATLGNAQTVLIRGATVHTVGEQGVLNNTDVLIREGKIAALGANLSAPSDATTVDAKGRALTPGLFGGLSGIGVEEVTLEPTTADAAVLLNAPAFEMQWRPEFDVTAAYNARSVLVPIARIEGLTWTVLTPSSGEGGTFVPGQGAAVTLDGRYDAVLNGSRSLFINLGGNANAMSAGSRAAQWMLLDQAIRETRSPSQDEENRLLHAAGREALARYLAGGRVVFNVSRAAEIRRAIAFAKRNGMKPVIAGGAEAWVVADELAREKVPVLLDALENLPYTFDGIGARLDNAALLHRAGVRIAFTQFNEGHNSRKIRQLAGNAVAHGLPKDAALAALTVQPAEIFGLASERGRVARGQVADLVLWSGDPLEVTSAADQVWIAGKAVDMRSRQTELRDRYLKRLQ
ncbi:MAG TPA: amidohydrolase family protein [Steroidobacteraceae bacterium]|nr:amidohydrolase family protein [Steroidobacteraceae bacterium]